MLKKLNNVKEYLDFADRINGDVSFCDPTLGSREQARSTLLKAPGNPAEQIFGCFHGEELIGLFVFLVLEEEAYLEMLAGLSRSEQAYDEIFSFLKENFKGCRADFVFNPQNRLLYGKLRQAASEFDPEQQKMVLQEALPCQIHRKVELYSAKYREQYLSLHSKEGYWTAEKVLNAPERFRILLAIEGEAVVGYVDITYQYEENEPFDVFVKEEYRRKGYAKAMLARAIELNRPRGMMLLVNTNNTAAIALYRSLGFVTQAGANSITAHALL